MSESTALVELREEFHKKQDDLKEVFDLAKDGTNQFDFSRKPVLEKLGATDETDALAKVKAANIELDELSKQCKVLNLREIRASIGDREDEVNAPYRGGHDHPPERGGGQKTYGQMFVESKEWKESKRSRTSVPLTLEIELKTLFQTSAGFAPESIRSGLLVEGATRPVQVLDLIPSFPINQAAFVYMEETTRTHSAAEKAEGVAFAESTFAWTQQTSTVRKITDSIPVTDEQLEDESQVRSLLDQRLRFGLRQRLDGQILTGNGTAPNLLGINNKTGVQTQAKGTDDRITAFHKGLTKIRYTGRAVPDGAIAHPNDWQDILLTKNANGDYLFGNPFMGPGPSSLFGIPVAVSDAQTENTVIQADFSNFTRLDDRRGVTILVGYSGTMFAEGEQLIRADLRAAFTILRAAAICKVTGM